MKRRLAFRLGKILQTIGRILAKPGEKLSWFGMELWVENCDCSKCIERRKEG